MNVNVHTNWHRLKTLSYFQLGTNRETIVSFHFVVHLLWLVLSDTNVNPLWM